MHSSIIKLKGMITNRFVLLTISFLIPIISFSQSKSELDVFKHTAIEQPNLQFLTSSLLNMILRGRRILVRTKFTLTSGIEYVIVL